MGLVVVSEEDARTLLVHKVSREDIYNRQGEETIIMWSDPDIGTDIALSFQEATGCNAIWWVADRAGCSVLSWVPHCKAHPSERGLWQ